MKLLELSHGLLHPMLAFESDLHRGLQDPVASQALQVKLLPIGQDLQWTKNHFCINTMP